MLILFYASNGGTSEIIPTLITCNIDVKISMKTANAQESVNVINCPNAFYLKDRGTGIVNLNGDLIKFKAMYVDDVSNYVKKESVQNVKIEEEVETVSKAVESISKFL